MSAATDLRPKPGEHPRAVAITGKAWTGSGPVPPWGEPGWEFWGLNERADWDPPLGLYTRWFQLHPPAYLERHHPPGLDDLARVWGRERGVRLYMDRRYDAYPDSEPYPKAAVEALVPHGRYHTSSFDWMMALAVLEGFRRIALYGVELRTGPVLNGEPVSGRPCLEYWAGVAEGRGATVEVHEAATDLFRTVHLAWRSSDLQYGFEREPALEMGDGWRDLR